jgi:two-component system, LuxR family, response regulator FixJ
MDKPPAVSVVAADAAVRQDLATRIKSMHLDARAFRSAAEFFETHDPAAAGCILLDVAQPGPRDLELLQLLSRERPHPPVIVLSAAADVPLAVRAMKMGAIDVLTRPASSGQLADAIQEALCWDSDNRKRIARAARLRARFARLKREEREVLQGLLTGQKNAEIAAELGLSVRAVETRRGKLMRAVRARSLAELVRLAIEADFRF